MPKRSHLLCACLLYTSQTELKAKVSEGRKRLSDEVQLANDAKQWVEAIQEYANITELDAATLNLSLIHI